MADTYSFPPYAEDIPKVIEKFGGELMETYLGQDIRPLWNLSGDGLPWSKKFLYKAPKLEKIVFAVQSFRDKLMSYATIIWPDDQHALPIFSSYWAESAKGSYFIIDFYPTADCIVDLPYLDKYIEPLEELFDKGQKYFPGLESSRNASWFKVLISPYCMTGDFSPSKAETQSRIMELTLGYLNVYLDLWRKDTPADPEYMKPLIKRREAIRRNFQDKDPGNIMMEHAVGQELADLGLKAIF